MIIDVNANISRWPFRRAPCDELPPLAESLRAHGVRQAWVGSLDGVFHRDCSGVHRRLAEDCRHQQRVQRVPLRKAGLEHSGRRAIEGERVRRWSSGTTQGGSP